MPLRSPSPDRTSFQHALSKLPGVVRRRTRRSLLILSVFLAISSGESRSGAAEVNNQPALQSGLILSRSYAFRGANQEMPYRLYISTRYRPDRPAPLLILLHALNSDPAQVIRYFGILNEAEKRGYIVAAPMGYDQAGWYGSQGPGLPTHARSSTPKDAPGNLGALSERDVLNVLAIVRREFRTDPKRTYLMGHSMGGGGTLYLGMKYPQTWAALAALAPAIYRDPSEVKALRNVPAIVVQGDRDKLVHVDVTRRWIAAMDRFRVPHEYIEIKGGGHVFSMVLNPKMIGRVFDFLDAHHR